MLITAALFLCLSEPSGTPAPHASRSNINCQLCVHDGLAPAETRSQVPQYEERELVKRLNGLAKALADFSQNYNSRGVIDVKNIKAIRKAWHELEKSEWFSRKSELR